MKNRRLSVHRLWAGCGCFSVSCKCIFRFLTSHFYQGKSTTTTLVLQAKQTRVSDVIQQRFPELVCRQWMNARLYTFYWLKNSHSLILHSTAALETGPSDSWGFILSVAFGVGDSHKAAQFNLTQSNEAKQESQQEQGEKEKAQQPLPPGATGVRTTA